MIGLILAAGEGRRMGGPKALLLWEGGSLLEAHLRASLAAGCSRAFGVVRATVASRVTVPPGASLVVSNEDDALGPAGSIAAFVRSEHFDRTESIALAPVDCLPDAWQALPELARALDDPDAIAARPSHHDRRGHPVLVRASVLSAYAARPRPLREALREFGPSVRNVPVALPAVLSDLDLPSDLPR